MNLALFNRLTPSERDDLSRLYRFGDQEAKDVLAKRNDGSLARWLHDEACAHHCSMARFSQTRIDDFKASLVKISVWPESAQKDGWLKSTTANIEYHETQLARHQAELVKLEPVQMQAAAE